MGKKLTKPKKTTSQPKMTLSNWEAIIPPNCSAVVPAKGCKNFPSDVLKWMKANARPLMALKLMQVCEYFQHENFPFELIKGLSKKEGGSWNYSTTENAFCAASTIDNIHHKNFLFITQYLYLYQRIDPFSSFLSKVAVYQAKSLHFDFQNITFNEFKILTAAGTIEKAKIRNTKITDENDKNRLAAVEKILECLPKVKELHFGEIVPSFVSWRGAAEVDVPKLRYLELKNIDDDFDHALFTWFKKNHPFIHCFITSIQREKIVCKRTTK